MKDLAHHLKKLNRQVIRSAHREEMEEEAWDMAAPGSAYIQPQTPKQVKKQKKKKMSKERKARAATPLTEDERNRKMRNRVPIFDRNKAKPKQGARKTSKKTPPI